jgi:hypothetical protein
MPGGLLDVKVASATREFPFSRAPEKGRGNGHDFIGGISTVMAVRVSRLAIVAVTGPIRG